MFKVRIIRLHFTAIKICSYHSFIKNVVVSWDWSLFSLKKIIIISTWNLISNFTSLSLELNFTKERKTLFECFTNIDWRSSLTSFFIDCNKCIIVFSFIIYTSSQSLFSSDSFSFISSSSSSLFLSSFMCSSSLLSSL